MGLFGPDVEKLKAERNFGALAKALTNRNADVRAQAVAAIAELGSPEAVPAIMDAFAGEQRSPMLQSASEALRGLGPVAVGAFMEMIERDQPEGQALRAAGGLGLMEDDGVPPLSELAGSEQPERRGYAAMALAAIDTPASVDVLGRLVEDEQGVVRMLAVRSLGTSTQSGARPHIIKAKDDSDPNVREMALNFTV